MDSPRPILDTELQFFDKGTGKGESLEVYAIIFVWYWGGNIHSSIGGYIHQVWWPDNQGIYKLEWYRNDRQVEQGKGLCW